MREGFCGGISHRYVLYCSFPHINVTTYNALKEMADWVESRKYSREVAGTLCGGPLLGQV